MKFVNLFTYFAVRYVIENFRFRSIGIFCICKYDARFTFSRKFHRIEIDFLRLLYIMYVYQEKPWNIRQVLLGTYFWEYMNLIRGIESNARGNNSTAINTRCISVLFHYNIMREWYWIKKIDLHLTNVNSRQLLFFLRTFFNRDYLFERRFEMCNNKENTFVNYVSLFRKRNRNDLIDKYYIILQKSVSHRCYFIPHQYSTQHLFSHYHCIYLFF